MHGIECLIEELDRFFEIEEVPLLIVCHVGSHEQRPPELDAHTQRLPEGFAPGHPGCEQNPAKTEVIGYIIFDFLPESIMGRCVPSLNGAIGPGFD